MKKDITSERDKDLHEAYKRAVKKLGKVAVMHSRKSLVRLAVNSAAKRFYISEERASRVIKMLESGRMPCADSVKKQMYLDILDAYNKLKIDERYAGVPKITLISIVVNSEAPSFYLDVRSAMSILNQR